MNKLKNDILLDKATKQHLEQIAGPLAPEIIKIYNSNKVYSSEELSQKLKKKITAIRSTLNSLHYRGIACYKKVRNKENNLFEFYWEIKFKKIVEIIIEHETEALNQIDEQIILYKGRDYFSCPKKCVTEPFETAIAYDFKCPNCNSPLAIQDASNQKKALKRKRTQISKNIEKLNDILNKIEDKKTGYICE